MTNPTTPQGADCEGRLANLPITLFGSVMGLTGLAIALMRYGHEVLHRNIGGRTLLYAVVLWFAFLLTMYLLKVVRYPGMVKEELAHPVKLNFFPAVSICLLLFAIAFLDIDRGISRPLWIIGAAVHLAFLLKIMHTWVTRSYAISMINPAWFIPVVGTILVPVAGVPLGYIEISWFFFSIGIIYWVVLFTIVINRIVFHEPMMEKLLPTLFILIAPPAVGLISYGRLNGDTLDPMARILYYFGVFTALMLATHVNRLRKLPFFVSWWAYTFPLDALTLSTIYYAKLTGNPVINAAAGFVIALAALVIAYVSYRTVRAAMSREICIPE